MVVSKAAEYIGYCILLIHEWMHAHHYHWKLSLQSLLYPLNSKHQLKIHTASKVHYTHYTLRCFPSFGVGVPFNRRTLGIHFVFAFNLIVTVVHKSRVLPSKFHTLLYLHTYSVHPTAQLVQLITILFFFFSIIIFNAIVFTNLSLHARFIVGIFIIVVGACNGPNGQNRGAILVWRFQVSFIC